MGKVNWKALRSALRSTLNIGGGLLLASPHDPLFLLGGVMTVAGIFWGQYEHAASEP